MGKDESIRWPAFRDADTGKPDVWLGVYAASCAACFGISHVDAIHLRLVRWVPRAYEVAGLTLPYGRAFFLLAFLQRGVANQQRHVETMDSS